MEYTLDEVLERLERELPSLGPTAAKVQKLGNDINVSPAELTRVIKLDPVLAARVMKLCNSSYCSPAQKIVSLERAVIMLGLNTIKNLALSCAVLQRLREEARPQPFDLEAFWTHSLAVGVAAKLYARARKVDKKTLEDYFLAGLVHDLGIPVESWFYPEEMEEVLEQANRMGLIRAEDYALCNLNHCLVGKALAEHWGFTGDLQAVLLQHHDPEAEGPHADLVLTVCLANMVCKANGVGLAFDPDRNAPPPPALYERLGLKPAVDDAVAQALPGEIEKAMVFLRV